MTESIKKFITLCNEKGLKEGEIIREMARFKAVDQMVSSQPGSRTYGLTGDDLFGLAKSTEDIFGPVPYDQDTFLKVYGPSFAVDIMDVITETGYYEGVAAGHQWDVPFEEIIEFHKHSEGIILFAYIEEYASLAERIMQEIPTDRLLFYTATPECFQLFRSMYPLAPVIDEWPEDVIFDHIVAASTGMFQAPAMIMEQLASRVVNLDEKGTAHLFIPLSAAWDQLNMNRVALQFLILQNRLEAIREWAPLGTYEFVYGKDTPKKVDLAIREVVGNEYKDNHFIPLPHEIVASMEAFTMADYSLSLCGVKPCMNPKNPTLGEDAHMLVDYRLPTYVQAAFGAYETHRLEVTMHGIDVKVSLVDAGHDGSVSPEEARAAVDNYEAPSAAGWTFASKEAAYVWYTYFQRPEGKLILRTLAQMVVSTEALVQLMGSCRREVMKEEALAQFAHDFEAAKERREVSLAAAEIAWQGALAHLGREVMPEMVGEEKPASEEGCGCSDSACGGSCGGSCAGNCGCKGE